MSYIPTWAASSTWPSWSMSGAGAAFDEPARTGDVQYGAQVRNSQDVIHRSDQGSQPGLNWSSQHETGLPRQSSRRWQGRAARCDEACLRIPGTTGSSRRHTVSVQRTRLERIGAIGNDGVHQANRWTPCPTPIALLADATVRD